MDISILGPLEVRRGDTAVPLGASKLRVLLLALTLELGRAVPSGRLVDQLWGEQPPPQPLVSLRSYISNLRRLIQEPGAPPVIVTGGGGYTLQVAADDLDSARFERLTHEARDALGAGDPVAALEGFDAALSLWRGEALAEVADEPFARPTAARLEALRLAVCEDRFEALLTVGRHVDAVPDLQAFVTEHQLRERPHRQLMLALYRSGRAVEALTVGADHRAVLLDGFGIDPSPELGELTEAILRQDPALDPPAAPPPSGSAPTDAAAQPSGTAPPDAATPATSPVPAGRRVTATVVGRDRERRVLAAALEELRTGHGGVVLVAGEPGIGKTAVLRELELLAESAGFTVAWGRCTDQEGAPPFWPWIEVVRTVADGLDVATLREVLDGPAAPVTHLAPEVAARAGISPDVLTSASESARFALYDAVATFLGAGASGHGLVVVLDDLHWADPASLQLLRFLTARTGDAAMLVVGSHRHAPTDRTAELDEALATVARQPGARTLQLRPLTREEVATIVVEAIGTDPDVDVLEDIQRRADGNPFFVHQLAALAVEDDRPTGSDGAIPAGARHVIAQRLQRLAPEVRSTLELAAVFGQGFDVRTVARADDSDVLTALDHVDVAIRHGLVEVGDAHASAYRFVHALVRESLYAELTPGRSARLHLVAARALEQLDRPPAEAIAEHLWLAAEVAPTTDTVRWLRDAAEEATAVLGYERAEQHLRRALRLLAPVHGDARTELAVRLRLVQVLTELYGWTAAMREEVSGRVRDLARHGGIGSELVPLWWSLWSTMMTRGDPGTSRELADELLEHAADDPASLVAGHVAVAYTALFAGADLDTVLGRLEVAATAEAGADPVSLGLTPEHLGVSLRVNLVMAHALRGDPADAVVAAGELLDHARRSGGSFQLAYACLFAAWGMAVIDRPDEALEHATVGLARAEEARLGYVAQLITPIHGWATARNGGDPKEQAERIGASIDALRTAGQLHAVTNWLLLHAEVLAMADDPAEARHVLDRAERLSRSIGEPVYEPQLRRVRATIGW